jgi:hypothetical protein
MARPSGRFFDGAKGRSDREMVLMVEGQDDAFFFDVLLQQVGADPDRVGLVYIEGKTNLEMNIADLTKSRAFVTRRTRKYAIVVDSDNLPARTIHEVHQALTRNDQPTPGHAAFQASAQGVEVGIFLIPSETEDGDLEKLCLATLGDAPLLRLGRDFLEQVNRDFGPLPSLNKSLAAIYLACRREDTRGVGLAFSQGIFNRDHACLEPVRHFLRAFIA